MENSILVNGKYLNFLLNMYDGIYELWIDTGEIRIKLSESEIEHEFEDVYYQISFDLYFFILIKTFDAHKIKKERLIRSNEIRAMHHYIYLTGEQLRKSKVTVVVASGHNLKMKVLYKVMYEPFSEYAKDKMAFKVIAKLEDNGIAKNMYRKRNANKFNN